jgi:hypothetical protein
LLKNRSKNSPILIISLALVGAARLSMPGSLIATATLGLLNIHHASTSKKTDAAMAGSMYLG